MMRPTLSAFVIGQERRAELTLGAVQLSLGKTDPPRSLIAFRIASLSFGSLYTGASDSESESSASSSSLGSGIAST